jgi:hypothetical protein
MLLPALFHQLRTTVTQTSAAAFGTNCMFSIERKMTFSFAFGCGISIAHQERQDRPLA